jgi:hypothetical protein
MDDQAFFVSLTDVFEILGEAFNLGFLRSLCGHLLGGFTATFLRTDKAIGLADVIIFVEFYTGTEFVMELPVAFLTVDIAIPGETGPTAREAEPMFVAVETARFGHGRCRERLRERWYTALFN